MVVLLLSLVVVFGVVVFFFFSFCFCFLVFGFLFCLLLLLGGGGGLFCFQFFNVQGIEVATWRQLYQHKFKLQPTIYYFISTLCCLPLSSLYLWEAGSSLPHYISTSLQQNHSKGVDAGL